MVIVVLALAPDLSRAVRPAFGIDIGEAAATLHHTVIGDGEARGVAEGHGAREEDDERIAVPRGAQPGAARPRDSLENELGARVEDH
jgi:hypothetical protein